MTSKIPPQIITPFPESITKDVIEHVAQIRRVFDWPGTLTHDHDAALEMRFNRWQWHNLPVLRNLHNRPGLIRQMSEIVGRAVKPSYCFLSMYTPDGVCPPHTDRPQCQYTLDLQISADGSWPIYIEKEPFILKNGEGLIYSGTEQEHHRLPMKEDGTCTFMNLAFFHFVPIEWQGDLG